MSVHFVNNVLAAAASYIEVEPDTARDVLAGLGAFLSHRLRPARIVPLAQELDHVAVYLKLEQARFPGRLEAELPRPDALPSANACPARCRRPWRTRWGAGWASAAAACASHCGPGSTARPSRPSSTSRTTRSPRPSGCASR